MTDGAPTASGPGNTTTFDATVDADAHDENASLADAALAAVPSVSRRNDGENVSWSNAISSVLSAPVVSPTPVIPTQIIDVAAVALRPRVSEGDMVAYATFVPTYAGESTMPNTGAGDSPSQPTIMPAIILSNQLEPFQRLQMIASPVAQGFSHPVTWHPSRGLASTQARLFPE